MLAIGTKAPDFILPSTNGKDFKLSRDATNEAIVIYFYPKDNTKFCTAEACQFRDNFDLLSNLSIKVIGISTDSIQRHESFKSKYKLPFELLSDKSGKVSKLYKAYIPFLNLSKRITYLLNTKHEIVESVSDLFNSEIHLNRVIKQLNAAKK